MKQNNELILFENKPIRHIEYEGEIFYSVIDVVSVLTDAVQPSAYWNKTKKTILNENQSLSFWQRLKLASSDGKNYLTDCANTDDNKTE